MLSRRLSEANNGGYFAQEALGQLQEDLHKFRQMGRSLLPLRTTTVPLLSVVQHGFCRLGWLAPKCWGTSAMLGACSPRMPRTGHPPLRLVIKKH